MLKLIVSDDIPQPVEARKHLANQEPAPDFSSQAGLSALRRGTFLAGLGRRS